MKKLMAVACLAVLAACGGGSTSGPSSVEQPATVAAAPATAPAAPQTVTAPGGIDVRWGQSASWTITNGSADTLRYTAQWTDFDNQALVRGSLDGVVAPGKTSEGSFDRGCVQADLVAGGRIFAFAFFDKAGRAFDPGTHPERIAECRPKPTPQPTPTPTPSPTPTPCADVVTHTAALRLTADKDDPNHGTSFFNYYIKKNVPGNNDPVIWSGRLAKGEKSPLVPVPNDHVGYYGQYDSENYSKTNVVHADCPKGLQAAWRPGLELVCTEQHSCPVE